MAQLNSTVSNNETHLRKRAGVRKMIKHYLKVDMTPMVDLGFLLISFFVITTELSKPTVMNLAMPAEGEPTDLANSAALTVLTKGNSIYYYQGEWEEAIMKAKVEPVEL
ncbi:MAG: biopolymer transporter ExbD, partial [Chitinophagaceae bacterium]|nr:biopolymer transporter ExbD [Chitinophagaceae bacterium]